MTHRHLRARHRCVAQRRWTLHARRLARPPSAMSATVQKSTAVTDSAELTTGRLEQHGQGTLLGSRARFFAHPPGRNLSLDGHSCTIACRPPLAPDSTARSRFRRRQQFAARVRVTQSKGKRPSSLLAAAVYQLSSFVYYLSKCVPPFKGSTSRLY